MKIRKIKRKKGIVEIVFTSILLLMCLAGCGKKEEDYRQIQVYKIDGTATVARAGSSMDVYENMQLQSGDVVETVANSYLQLKLDEDKYILLEPETKISLQATGNSADSNTAIFLEKGAIVNQLDNPLSEKSDYQVTTPNSTMAVRGTTFRVEITYDENGESFAKVAVYGGKVECMLVFPDGTTQEPVMIEPGTEVLVRGDQEESEYVMTKEASYDELKETVLDFLDMIISNGKELSITREEIEVLIEVQKALEEGEVEVEVVPEEEEEIQDEELEEETKPETIEQPKEEDKKEEQEQEEQKTEEQQSAVTPDNSSSESDSASSAGSSGGDSNSGASGDTSGGNSNSGGSEDNIGDGTSGDGTSELRNVVVKFVNSDKSPFAEKTICDVASDATEISIEQRPILQPTAEGKWMYGNSEFTDTTLTITKGQTEVIITWAPKVE